MHEIVGGIIGALIVLIVICLIASLYTKVTRGRW